MNNQNVAITCGADPEVFVQDFMGGMRSIIGLIGGSKDEPLPLTELGDGFAVQEDNVAMEFNIPPSASAAEFDENIRKVLDTLSATVKGKYGFNLCRVSAVSFPEMELQNPAALVFGCDPDFDAWTGKTNPRPSAEDKNLRSCGGHIHVGYDKAQAKQEKVIQYMDMYLGVPSVLMDTGELRKKLYGKSGAFRYKPFGLEYRTLSNFWIFDPALRQWAFRNTQKAVNAAVAQPDISNEDGQLIVRAINDNDKDLAQALINRFNLEVLHV